MTDSERSLFGKLRIVFLSGLVVTIPLGLTYWFFQGLLRGIDGILSPVLIDILGRDIPGLGFLSMVTLIFAIGLLTRNLIGNMFIARLEKLLVSIPFVRSVYTAIKELLGAFMAGGKGNTFRQVVLIQYPRKGLFCAGFVTNETIIHSIDNEPIEVVNVYIPNPPNPTSGMLVLVPKSEAVPLDMTVEQGLKFVLSGGIVSPERLAPQMMTQPKG